MIVIYDETNEIGEAVDDTEYTDNGDNTASETDAVLLHVSQEELDEAVSVLPQLYDIFSLWFFMWLGFKLFSLIKPEIFKNTSEMRDKR